MRADKYFAEIFSSRTKAAEALKKGLILANGKPLTPSDEVDDSLEFSFLFEEVHFVSNGGYKLHRALTFFQEDVKGLVFADLGSSTGGFCDCLLKSGAGHVFCVDVGKSLLDESISRDMRVTVMEGVNARNLKSEDFPLPLDGVSADLSFISLKKVLPAIAGILPMGKKAFLLFKPQFECDEKNMLKKGGICPIRLHQGLLSSFYDAATAPDANFSLLNIVNAPIRPRKNVEYMLLLRRGEDERALDKAEFLLKASKLIP